MSKKIILSDNQYITNKGLAAVLNEEKLADEIKIAATSKELMRQLHANPAATVILDYTLFDFSIEQMLNMRTRFPFSTWLLFSDELSKFFLRQVLNFDLPFGVVLKTDSAENIADALRQTAAGQVFICETAQHILKEDVPPDNIRATLTAAERLVLREIAMGKTTKEIASELFLSFHTINTHRKNIFRKLEINNVHEAVKYALRAGILDLAEYYM